MDKESDKILISWAAPEFVKKEKGRAWFVMLGIITLALFVTGILMKNYIFSIIIALASFLIFIQALRRPQKIKTEIFEDCVVIDDHFKIVLKEIKSFWIFEENDLNTLCFETNKLTHPKIYLPLGQQTPDSIRQVLARFIREIKQEESLIDIISRKVNF